jgi:hypothetical protein
VIHPERIDGDEQHAEPVALRLEFDISGILSPWGFKEPKIDDGRQETIQSTTQPNCKSLASHVSDPALFS